jgi:hypothetical protein
MDHSGHQLIQNHLKYVPPQRRSMWFDAADVGRAVDRPTPARNHSVAFVSLVTLNLAAFSEDCMMSGELVALPREGHWADSLMTNAKGAPLGNLANVLHALRNAPEWRDVLAYDEFNVRVVTHRPPPWSNHTVSQWADHEDTLATMWFQQHDIPAPHGTVGRGIQAVARENSFHPVRDYLSRLIWDGKRRLDKWLTVYLGVKGSQQSRWWCRPRIRRW